MQYHQMHKSEIELAREDTECRDRNTYLLQLEDEYSLELEQTGFCKALDISEADLITGAQKKYGGTKAVHTGGYLCDLIEAKIDSLEWS